MKLTKDFRVGAVGALGLLLAFGCGLPSDALAGTEERFNTPQAATDALKSAVETGDTNALRRIFSPAAHALVSADMVQAANERALFLRRVKEKVNLVRTSPSREVLELGNDAWPFPIPVVQDNGKWFFDLEAGREEILNRRIGANELGAIRVCRAYVQAQREYASADRNGEEVLEYAQHLRSAPGTHDGLYWPVQAGEELSPLGPLVAQAHAEGYAHRQGQTSGEHAPYHGYYFKIVTRQGKHAPGGKYDYTINGHMIAGFALVAWPAEWGNTGIMTFIVNQRGKVYEKNLGPKTDAIASKITTYDPDQSWSPVK